MWVLLALIGHMAAHFYRTLGRGCNVNTDMLHSVPINIHRCPVCQKPSRLSHFRVDDIIVLNKSPRLCSDRQPKSFFFFFTVSNWNLFRFVVWTAKKHMESYIFTNTNAIMFEIESKSHPDVVWNPIKNLILNGEIWLNCFFLSFEMWLLCNVIVYYTVCDIYYYSKEKFQVLI